MSTGAAFLTRPGLDETQPLPTVLAAGDLVRWDDRRGPVLGLVVTSGANRVRVWVPNSVTVLELVPARLALVQGRRTVCSK